ncbi:MAG: hypothetical protein M1114_03115 [Candidatus Dependentiae bacterium]|nr:hypothetical protein [Candidatus Dependentiae bacterium]
MPELPEVEYFKKIFSRVLKKKIADVVYHTPSLLKKTTPKKFSDLVIGRSFTSVVRKGKFLIAKLSGTENYVVLHFGMTGWLEYKKQTDFDDTDKRFGQIIFALPGGYSLLLLDKRKFAKVYVVRDINEIKTLQKMGVDALTISAKDFFALLDKKKSRAIKAVLMDQALIAGIGNEYSNEILYQAKINPARKCGALTLSEQKKIYTKMRALLRKAVSFGGVQKLPPSWLLYHIKISRDMRCPDNKMHLLKRKTIGGRSAIYCPIDQK